jgi:hypothetical protein
VDYEAIVRKTCRDIGFISEDVGLNADTCKVLVHIEEQSPDIGQGVHGMGTKTLEEVCTLPAPFKHLCNQRNAIFGSLVTRPACVVVHMVGHLRPQLCLQ